MLLETNEWLFNKEIKKGIIVLLNVMIDVFKDQEATVSKWSTITSKKSEAL